MQKFDIVGHHLIYLHDLFRSVGVILLLVKDDLHQTFFFVFALLKKGTINLFIPQNCYFLMSVFVNECFIINRYLLFMPNSRQ